MATTRNAAALDDAIHRAQDATAAWAELLAHFPEVGEAYLAALAEQARRGSQVALTEMAWRFVGKPVAYVVDGVEVFRGVLESVQAGWAAIRQPSGIPGHAGYVDQVRVDLMRP